MPELIQTLVNRNGKLVPEERPKPKASPAHVVIPRTGGKDFVNSLSTNMRGFADESPIGGALMTTGILGIGGPMTLYDLLMDRLKPKMEARDVNLPSEGPIDTRLVR